GFDLIPCQGAAQVGHCPACLHQFRGILVYVVHQEHPAPQAGEDLIDLCAIEPGTRCSAFESIQQASLITLCLQAADEPCTDIGECLVVQVNRILRCQYDTHTKRTRLLEQREHGQLRWRIACGWEVSKNLIHVDQGAQAG